MNTVTWYDHSSARPSAPGTGHRALPAHYRRRLGAASSVGVADMKTIKGNQAGNTTLVQKDLVICAYIHPDAGPVYP
jgi:hypothetical protein